ncbi:hypothetical protein [Streptomyces bacillaris]|uniref:hypothetical protein n=1 Tax=Streptomyces bacillaris TaxID=68179 RepID=UPI000DD79FC0
MWLHRVASTRTVPDDSWTTTTGTSTSRPRTGPGREDGQVPEQVPAISEQFRDVFGKMGAGCLLKRHVPAARTHPH